MKLFLTFILLQFLWKSSSSASNGLILQIFERYSNEIFDSVNNTVCVEQLKILLSDVKSVQLWALNMLDAWGKLPPGVLSGNIMFLGNYDECLDINVVRNNSNILGQYCSTMVKPKAQVQTCAFEKLEEKNISSAVMVQLEDALFINWDICVPAACTTDDLQNIWNFIEDRYQSALHLVFKNDRCSTIEKQSSYTDFEKITVLIFGIIGSVIALSTIYDVLIFQKRKDKHYNFLMAFSYYTNFKRLISTKREDDTNVTCLHGLRVISMAWIILGHGYLYGLLTHTAINNLYFMEWLQQEETVFIEGALACVDTFFVISGFLIVYVVLLAKEKGISMNLFIFWGHRFLRLQPGLAAMVLLYLGLLPHMGSGPYWYLVVQNLKGTCVNNWWTTLLHIQTYLNPSEACILQSWYLAVDTQLYLLSPLIFLPLLKWQKMTILFILGLIGASFAATIYTTFYYDINSETMEKLFNFYDYLYNPVYVRMSPWLTGTLLGYTLFKTKDKNIILKTAFVVLLWIITIGTMLGVIYPYNLFLRHTYSTTQVALFLGVSRIAWGMCICWIIFACTQGYGGYINTFLSLPVFRILARLNYSLYLTHYLVIFLVRGQMATNSYVSNFFEFHGFWGNFAFTVGLSVIWTLTFESPVSILESVLIKREIKKHEKPVGNHVSDILNPI